MAKMRAEPQPYVKPDLLQIRGNEVFSPLRQKWVPLTPEERVRQEYLTVLVREYGFTLEHMAEEVEVTGTGSAKARADFIIWRTPQEKTDQNSPLIVVECKADNVTIDRTPCANFPHGRLVHKLLRTESVPSSLFELRWCLDCCKLFPIFQSNNY
jgi:hypothetical protein